jgi:hypothetical protein
MQDANTTEEPKAAIVVNPGPNSFNGRQLIEAFGKCSFQICIVCMVKSLGVRPIAMTVDPKEETATSNSGPTIFVPQKNRGGRPKKEVLLTEG